MDPNAAVKMLLLALADEDSEQAIDSLDAIKGWILKGGFPPKVTVQGPRSNPSFIIGEASK